MKKLFSVNNGELVFTMDKYGVFQIYSRKDNKNRYLNWDGVEVDKPIFPSYDSASKEKGYYGDPSACNYLGEGYYSFTSHSIDWDPDGPFGCFGIKDIEGNIIVEEKYWQIESIFNGLFPVREKDGDWGCVDKKGELVYPCIYWEPVNFNNYGVAYGNESLIDVQGKEIEDTRYNCIEMYMEKDRYIPITFTTPEQDEEIDRTGTAEGITQDIYDTKLREYVVKGIPECKLDLFGYDGEPEPILAAVKMIENYDGIDLDDCGVIRCRIGGRTDVYDYYK